MVIFSNRKSIEAEQVSALSVLETIVSIAISVAIYFFLHSTTHIIVAVLIAPFLLMRTERSTDDALVWAAKLVPLPVTAINEVQQRIMAAADNAHSGKPGKFVVVSLFMFLEMLLVLGLLVLTNVLIALLIKISVTVWNIVAHPIECCSAIPKNWRRIVLYTDSATFPELIPGLENSNLREGPLRIIAIETMIRDLQSRVGDSWLFKLMAYLVISMIYLPAIAYRFSLKSTAPIWSPLLWAIRPIAKAESAAHFAEGVLHLTKNKLARWYSTFVILLFSAKVLLWLCWFQLGPSYRSFFSQPAVERYVAPADILTWHLAALINATLTWWLYFYAEEYLFNLARGAKQKTSSIFFSGVSILRNFLTVYTLFCSAYITASLSSHLELPPLRIILVPW